MKARLYFYATGLEFCYNGIVSITSSTNNHIIFTMENGENEVINLNECSVKMFGWE